MCLEERVKQFLHFGFTRFGFLWEKVKIVGVRIFRYEQQCMSCIFRTCFLKNSTEMEHLLK